MYTKEEREATRNLIRKFGITPKYKGYYYTIDAVSLYLDIERSELLVKVTKDIYPTVAKKYKTNASSVERSIRTVIGVCWDNNKELLKGIADCPLLYKPSNSEFLDMLAYYVAYKR